MRWPGLIEAYKEFLPVSIQSSLVYVKKLPNDELAVTQHIKGVVTV
ncbi:hypothetical protein P5G62_026675 [Neobacillus sp. 179-C4.2 HS]|uniref:Uncharacterized protein n=1 Tax=Neobacillus driksii TaxID=3035913 RepID=A0ABV4Z0T1_9BACI|nr:hypothetical protein [Neobacillus sp. 179.-C4.2 HS]MDP5195939.1 hypothetical protein [Neobacillus sp. 179.-C4.2 HS]